MDVLIARSIITTSYLWDGRNVMLEQSSWNLGSGFTSNNPGTWPFPANIVVSLSENYFTTSILFHKVASKKKKISDEINQLHWT